VIRVVSLTHENEMHRILQDLHVDETGIKIMMPKMNPLLLQLDAVTIPAANILKQEMLSLGGDAALHRGACDFSVKETGCLLIGSLHHYQRLIKKLSAQPFGLKKIGKEIKALLDRYQTRPEPMKLGPYLLNFSKGSILMGILNVTPDSFSGDGVGKNIELALKKAEKLIAEGADILDIGGESTRPGASSINAREEKERVIPIIKAIAKRFDKPISIDTSKSSIAEEALSSGAHLVNDVTGLLGDERMIMVLKKWKSPVVVMHHEPASGRAGVMANLCSFFEERMEFLETNGIPSKNIILDPGIGFGKNSEDNLVVLKRLAELKSFGRPILLGTSRKSFIGKILNLEPKDRIVGTAASLVVGRMNGAHIFRVHDVREAREALAITEAIQEAE